MWAVREMGRDRKLHFGLSMEGLLVRYYEAARAIHAELLDHLNGKASPDWDSRSLDDVLKSLGGRNDDCKWARLLRLIRNDIVHNRGVARLDTAEAAMGLTLPGPPAVIGTGKLMGLHPQHLFELYRQISSIFARIAGIDTNAIASLSNQSLPEPTILTDGWQQHIPAV